jgi:hypothetical protein
MALWRILDLDGNGPDAMLPGDVEADTPCNAVRRSCEFVGDLRSHEETGHWRVHAFAKVSRAYPNCHTCGPGNCVGHQEDSCRMSLVVVKIRE